MSTGMFTLGDLTITDPDTYVGTWSTGHAGALAATVQLRFAYGSGGMTTRVYLQTSLDAGLTAVDLACVLFATSTSTVILNFSGTTPSLFSADSPPVPLFATDGDLPDDSAIDGVLGDRFRVKVITTGTYATQTLLSSRITLR